MKINIISRSIGKRHGFGAAKVLQNTQLGLRDVSVDVRVNEPISQHEHNWIHDDPRGIIEAGFADVPVIVGPNTAITPSDLPRFRPRLHPDSIYLFPSNWPLTAWAAVGFRECRKAVWAAGLDLDRLPSKKRMKSDPEHVLLYFKYRDETLLSLVTSVLARSSTSYEVIRYGEYTQDEFIAALLRAKCGVWLGSTESQGFALLEAMATGLPLIVLDATSLDDNHHGNDVPVPSFPRPFVESGATSAPYFDESCGLKIEKASFSGKLVVEFLEQVEKFDPSGYVRSAFSLRQSALKFLQLAQSLPPLDRRGRTVSPTLTHCLRFADLATRPRLVCQLGRARLKRLSWI